MAPGGILNFPRLLLSQVEDVLRDMHADKPRPSFEAACAEVRACTFTDETGEEFMLGIDDGESDDVIDEVMEVILADRDWDEAWSSDEDCDEEDEGDNEDESDNEDEQVADLDQLLSTATMAEPATATKAEPAAVSAPASPCPGARVRLVGLEKAAELNGAMGIILDRQPGSSDRWQVRLDSGIQRAIREANLEGVEWTDAELIAARTRARPAADQELISALPQILGQTGDDAMALIGAGLALMGDGKSLGNPAAAVAKYRAALASGPEPEVAIMATSGLAQALQQCQEHGAALEQFLHTAELSKAMPGIAFLGMWAQHIAEAFRKCMGYPELPRPSWWTDAALLELSEQVAAYGPTLRGPLVWHMRAAVLAAEPVLADDITPVRTAAQYREAAACYTRAADNVKGRPEEPSLRNAARHVLLLAGTSN